MMHPIFLKRTFNAQEIADGTAKSIAEFKQNYPDWYPCEANAEKLLGFLVGQLGTNEGPEPEYPYPYLLENLQFSYHSILDQGGWFYARPETPQEEQARLVRENAQRQQEIADENRRRQPEQELAEIVRETTQLAKDMPLSTLRVVVANERPSSPNGKKHQVETLPGGESRPFGMSPRTSSQPVPAKVMQEARRQVSLDNPTLPRDGVRFNQLVHELIQKSSNA
jgi:hypothetical protein